MQHTRPAIGIVGLGLMGSALARRLIGAGFAVFGYDLEPSKCAVLRDIGGSPAASLADLGAACDRVLLAVFDTRQVEEVLERPDGLLPAGPRENGPRIVITTSTCDPVRISALGERLGEREVALLECPISGTSDQVAKGDGVGLLAGDEGRIAEIDDILDAICRRRYFMGPLGNGNRTKLAVNLILGLNRTALAEGLVFAERLGLPLDAFLDVARGSAAYSQVMDVKGDKMVAGDFAPHGKIAQSRKDFSLILEMALQAGQRLPLASVYAELMQGCIEHGEGEWDNAAVIEEIRRRRER